MTDMSQWWRIARGHHRWRDIIIGAATSGTAIFRTPKLSEKFPMGIPPSQSNQVLSDHYPWMTVPSQDALILSDGWPWDGSRSTGGVQLTESFTT